MFTLFLLSSSTCQSWRQLAWLPKCFGLHLYLLWAEGWGNSKSPRTKAYLGREGSSQTSRTLTVHLPFSSGFFTLHHVDLVASNNSGGVVFSKSKFSICKIVWNKGFEKKKKSSCLHCNSSKGVDVYLWIMISLNMTPAFYHWGLILGQSFRVYRNNLSTTDGFSIFNYLNTLKHLSLDILVFVATLLNEMFQYRIFPH